MTVYFDYEEKLRQFFKSKPPSRLLMQRISSIMIIGTSLLSLGIVILSLSYYLDKLDQEYGKAWELAHPCNYLASLGCPISPEPYWKYIQPLLYIGIVFCCIGIIVISAKTLYNRMRTLQNH